MFAKIADSFPLFHFQVTNYLNSIFVALSSKIFVWISFTKYLLSVILYAFYVILINFLWKMNMWGNYYWIRQIGQGD